MPVVTLEAAGLNREQKNKLIKSYTGTTAEVLKVPPEAIIVLLKENSLENIGFGGKALADR